MNDVGISFSGFAAGFEGGLSSLNVLFMQSDGGLTSASRYAHSPSSLMTSLLGAHITCTLSSVYDIINYLYDIIYYPYDIISPRCEIIHCLRL